LARSKEHAARIAASRKANGTYVVGAEQRAKLSKALSGRKKCMTPEGSAVLAARIISMNKDPELNARRRKVGNLGRKLTPEHRERIGKAQRGKKRSPEMVRKWQLWWRTLSKVEQDAILRRLNLARSFQQKDTSLERIVGEFLQTSRILHQRQTPFGRYTVDFLLPSLSLIIECDGEYWHRASRTDKRKDTLLNSLGLTVLRLPEKVILSGEFEAILQKRLQYG